jgi:hypothetical protein
VYGAATEHLRDDLSELPAACRPCLWFTPPPDITELRRVRRLAALGRTRMALAYTGDWMLVLAPRRPQSVASGDHSAWQQ